MSAGTHGSAVGLDEGVHGKGERNDQENAQSGHSGSQDSGNPGKMNETVVKVYTTTTINAATTEPKPGKRSSNSPGTQASPTWYFHLETAIFF